jgi:hypothetical protein
MSTSSAAPPSGPLDEIRELAVACDEHAAALGAAVKQLHHKITEFRQRNDGRGPSGLRITSMLERRAAQYFAGAVLRTARGPLAMQRTFRQQVDTWLVMFRPSAELHPRYARI